MHGCGMGYENIQFALPEYSGFNDYAVANDLIVLYPQADGNFPKNWFNCWNVGDLVFMGEDSETRWGNTGFQNMAIKGMVDRLTSEKSDEYHYDMKMTNGFWGFTNNKNVLDRSALTQFVLYSGTYMMDLPHNIIVGGLMILFSMLGMM